MDFDRQVKELARIRDEEGYMAESKKMTSKSSKHVLLEYNCPIIHIAEKHWEACSVETNYLKNFLMQKLRQPIELQKVIRYASFSLRKEKRVCRVCL